MFGVFMLVVTLATAGVTHPKALVGSIIVIAIFGVQAAKGFAFEKKKSSPEFAAEKKWLLDVLRKNSEFEPALVSLGGSYRIVGDSAGVTSSGRCRVIDLSGAIADVRVEVRKSKITGVSCNPKPDNSFAQAVGTLKNQYPPKPPTPIDLTPRDWMGNPLDRK